MTRINTVDVTTLSRQHLVAEYREITRVFALSAAAHDRGLPVIPTTYRMGAGHVTFFYDKLGYIDRRFDALVAEMENRGYSPTMLNVGLAWRSQIPASAWQDWKPSEQDVEINMKRLVERDPEHYGK